MGVTSNCSSVPISFSRTIETDVKVIVMIIRARAITSGIIKLAECKSGLNQFRVSAPTPGAASFATMHSFIKISREYFPIICKAYSRAIFHMIASAPSTIKATSVCSPDIICFEKSVEIIIASVILFLSRYLSTSF